MAIIRVVPGGEWLVNLRKAIEQYQPGDELRLFCRGAIVDAKKVLARHFPGKQVEFKIEPIGYWRETADALHSLITDIPDQGFSQLSELRECIAGKLSDDGFDEFVDSLTPLDFYSHELSVGILCTTESLSGFRQVVEKLSDPNLKAVVGVFLHPETSVKLIASQGTMDMIGRLTVYRVPVVKG